LNCLLLLFIYSLFYIIYDIIIQVSLKKLYTIIHKGKGMEQPLQPLKSHAELAYDFFIESERVQRRFTPKQLAEATGYTEGTVRIYLAKKWWWFAKKEQGFYTVYDFARRCSLQAFLQDLSQKQKSSDFQAREQAIFQVATANPANIQEVAASQLSIINSYYQNALQQSQQSFRWSLVWGGVGLVFLMASVSFLLLRQPTDVALASGIGGAIVEAFAATYLYLYKHASDQLAAFRASLEGTQHLLLANSMCERLEGDVEQNARSDLIRVMVSAAVSSSSKAYPETKK
jgi:hypothetical protein